MARAEPTGVPVNPATTGSVTTGSVTTGSVPTGSVTTGSVTTGSGAGGSMSDVAAMVASGPATVSGDADSMSVSPVGVRASCTGAGPTRGEELADHRAGHLQLVGDGLLGPPRPCPHLGLGDLAAGELRWPAAAVADQGGRTALAGPAAKHRHVGRGEPKEEGHLVDPAAGVGQCHDRQVAHPGVVRLVPVNQRPPVGHQYLPIGGQKTQRGRLRHPLQLALSHAFSLSQSQRILDDMARRRVLLTGHFGHYLRRSEALNDLVAV